MIICEDVFRCEDIGELRDLAREFYIDNLANTEVYNDEVGLIKFSKAGYKKPLSFSGDIRKIKLFAVLKELVKEGKIFNREVDRYKREKTEWLYLKTSVILYDIKLEIIIDIRKDCNGILYYDHVIYQ
ncbi:MAG: hypothetical protein LBQ13_00790 [Endomicrobium sp.]|jgi:hypothetical protein|nr:hypothetical protein [Endomicrobium sp.]